MHRIVSFASPPGQVGVDLSSSLAGLPDDLKSWGAVPMPDAGVDSGSRLEPEGGHAQAESEDPSLTWTPPHERALAQALGLEAGDGQVPIGGLLAARAGLPRDGRPWARVSPVHWHLGTEQVTMRDPSELALEETEARALFESARPWFEEEGYTLHWLQPALWLAAHPGLAGLRTASLDRVSGRNVDLWLGADPQARRLRRLQSEVQMLWHTHPVNARRESEGLEPVNSFWIDGCGPIPDETALQRACGVVLDERLRAPALQGDGPRWLSALRQVVQDIAAESHDALQRGRDYRVTWCGERLALTWAPPRPAPAISRLWSGVRRALRPIDGRRAWPACLETL